MRYIDEVGRKVFNFAAHMNDRLIFRDFAMLSKLPAVLKDNSMMKFGLLIGEHYKVFLCVVLNMLLLPVIAI